MRPLRVRFEFVLGNAHNVMKTTNSTTKRATKSPEIAISAHTSNLGLAQAFLFVFWNTSRASGFAYDIEPRHEQPQLQRAHETQVVIQHPIKIYKYVGPNVVTFSPWSTKPRALNKIILRDELYEPRVRLEFVLGNARNATKTKFHSKRATKPSKSRFPRIC